MKLNVAVLYGSRTCEHDVSIISALQAINKLDATQYNVIPIYISREGDWFTGEKLRDSSIYANFDATKATRILPNGAKEKLELLAYPSEKKSLFASTKRIVAVADVAMIIMHGMNGEDGTLQGMLDMWNVPYTSAGVMGSSAGMDKILMKQVFKGSGLPVLDSDWVSRDEWQRDKGGCILRIEKKLAYPLYVKPSNLGSSIGINKAVDAKTLANAIDIASAYDRRILIEKGVEQLSEVNCSVLGFGGDVTPSVCEMPVRWDEFLTFDEKYMRGGKGSKESSGMNSLERRIPAPIGDEMTAQVQEMAVNAFKMLDCKGVVRIDFIIDQADNKLYINEINTIPGSLAFYLWEATGVSFAALLNKMIELAFVAHAEKNRSVFSYNSQILKKIVSGAKGSKGSKN